jgi:dihydrofolate reductase
MRKVIAAFNMTLDGVCDHTTGIADEELHNHYADLIDNGDVILYGRTTFQLMQFWQDLAKKPSGEKSMDDFATSLNRIPKIVFSHTIKETGWDSATFSQKSLEDEVQELKKQQGGDILVGSRSLIVQLLNSNLIDELQICIHPVIEGKGLKLFDRISDRIMLELSNTKVFNSGVTLFFYKPGIPNSNIVN